MFCKTETDKPIACFWIQFVNFELDENWMMKMDVNTFNIAQKHGWKREMSFVGKCLGVEMSCELVDTTAPLVLLVAFLDAMKLNLSDATQFVTDAIDEEEEDE